MSIIYLNWAFSLPITGAAKAVLIALADRANEAGFCYPSLSNIAQRSGCSRMTAIRSVEKLEALGFLEKMKGNGRSNGYFLKAKLSTDTSNTSNNTLPDNGYPQVTQCNQPVTQCYEGSNTVLPKSSDNHHVTKEMRARETGDKTTPATMTHASFQTWTPAAMPKADRKTVNGELRSIKSILGARA